MVLLSKSFKNKYPFRLGTTSYIYPDRILPNVMKLGPFLDEIELLLFESDPGSLPDPKEIASLREAAREFDITYNIHLPTDIYLGADNPDNRQQAVDISKKIFDLTRCLTPSTCTLHLEYDMPSDDESDRKRWQENVCNSMEKLLSYGMSASSLSVETLTYPYAWIANIVEALDLSVCLDVGHLFIKNVDAVEFYNAHADKVSIIHLHGRTGRDDHKPLNTLSESEWAAVLGILEQFHGVVSLEVFNLAYLESSLKELEERIFHDG